jgi:hypothetical protein
VIETKNQCQLTSKFGYAECIKEKEAEFRRKRVEREVRVAETLTASETAIERMI